MLSVVAGPGWAPTLFLCNFCTNIFKWCLMISHNICNKNWIRAPYRQNNASLVRLNVGLRYGRKYSSSILNKTLTELEVDIDLQFCNQRGNIARSAFIFLELAKEIQFKNVEQSQENKAYKQNIFHLAKRLHQTILYVDFAVVIWVWSPWAQM